MTTTADTTTADMTTGRENASNPCDAGTEEDGLLVRQPVARADYGELEPDTPPLIDEHGRVRLSYSRIDAYRQCPLKFRYRYIDRLPTIPSPHLSFGSAIHTALERLYDRKLADWPDADELVGYLYDAWDSRGFQDLPRSEQLRWYRRAQDVLRRYHRREAGTFALPVGTEVWFELPVGEEALVVGSIDRVDVDDDGAFHLVDYKTGKVRDRSAVASSLQLGVYALACRHLYGRLPASVCLDFVAAEVQVRVPAEDLDLEGARTAILETAQAVRDEVFTPTPTRLCDWCDFREVCPAWEGDGPDVLGPATVELDRLQRTVRRDVARLRALEDGVDRAREALRERGLDPGDGGNTGDMPC